MSDIEFFFVGGGVNELTYIGAASVNATGGTLFPHADTEVGDLLILLDAVNTGSPSNTGTPSGWQEAFAFLVQTDCRLRCHVAEATSGIISSGVLPLQGPAAGAGAATLYTLRPDVDITTISWSGSPQVSSGASTTSLSHTVDADTEAGPLVVVSLAQQFAGVLSSTPAFDVSTSFGVIDFGLAIENTAPVDHDITTTAGIAVESEMASTWISVI